MQQSALKCCPLPFGAHVNQPAHDQKQLFPHLLYFWGCRQKPDGKVHFSKPTDNLKLYLSLGAISLFLSGTSTRLVKVGKISWFGLQYLIWSSQIWLRWPHLSNSPVAMNTTGNCPEIALKISSDFMPTNAETQHSPIQPMSAEKQWYIGKGDLKHTHTFSKTLSKKEVYRHNFQIKENQSLRQLL